MSMNNKSRILYILKILYEYTDEENTMSITEIIEMLEKQGIEELL